MQSVIGRWPGHKIAKNRSAPFIHSFIVDEWETTNLNQRGGANDLWRNLLVHGSAGRLRAQRQHPGTLGFRHGRLAIRLRRNGPVDGNRTDRRHASITAIRRHFRLLEL